MMLFFLDLELYEQNIGGSINYFFLNDIHHWKRSIPTMTLGTDAKKKPMFVSSSIYPGESE